MRPALASEDTRCAGRPGYTTHAARAMEREGSAGRKNGHMGHLLMCHSPSTGLDPAIGSGHRSWYIGFTFYVAWDGALLEACTVDYHVPILRDV